MHYCEDEGRLMRHPDFPAGPGVSTLGWKPKKAVVHSFPASDARARLEGNTLAAENLGLYTVVELG